ncbi:MAG TPA: hypothetical protein VK468_05950 [Pyrinomonadaceae bacterium]|nr:hypothetical protein [Pyrinomonadaceae bacterium]
MSENKSQSSQDNDIRWPSVFYAIAAIVALWVLSYVTIWTYFGKLDDASRFGEMFGAINALFSGLALAGIVFAILLQRKELQLQREELKSTREELKRAAEAQERSEKAFADQATSLALTAKLNALSLRPVLEPNIWVSRDQTRIQLKNLGRTSAYGIEIFLLSMYEDQEVSLKKLVRTNNHLLRKGKGPLSRQTVPAKDVVIPESGEYHLYERLDRFFLSDKKKLVGTTGFPPGSMGINALLQFRDAQGINYSQLYFYGSPSNSGNGTFELLDIDPVTPEMCHRLTFALDDSEEKGSLRGCALVPEDSSVQIKPFLSDFVSHWNMAIPIGKVNVLAILETNKFIELDLSNPLNLPLS